MGFLLLYFLYITIWDLVPVFELKRVFFDVGSFKSKNLILSPIRMDLKNLPILKEDSKWFSSTSIAAYIIVLATILSMVNMGLQTYYVYTAQDIDGESYFKGRLKDSETDEPIAYATITNEETGKVYLTDSGGNYSVDKEQAGFVILKYSKPGYRSQRIKLYFEPGSKDARVDLKTLKLEPFPRNEIINDLPMGTISGKVSLKNGSAIPDASITVDMIEKERDSSILGFFKNNSIAIGSESDGAFEISGLPAGRLLLNITVDTSDFGLSVGSSNIIVYNEYIELFVPSGQTTNVEIVLDDSKWNLSNADHFIYNVHTNLIETSPLELDFIVDAKASGRPIELEIINQQTGQTVVKKTVNGSITENLPQGRYTVFASCEDCSLAVLTNVSLFNNASETLSISYGEEPEYIRKDNVDGFYQCLMVHVVLWVIAIVGAYFSFSKRKYLPAMVGAIVTTIMQTPGLMYIVIPVCTVNVILGVLAFVLIFRQRQTFIDAPQPKTEGAACPAQLPTDKTRKEEPDEDLDQDEEDASQEDEGKKEDLPTGKPPKTEKKKSSKKKSSKKK